MCDSYFAKLWPMSPADFFSLFCHRFHAYRFSGSWVIRVQTDTQTDKQIHFQIYIVLRYIWAYLSKWSHFWFFYKNFIFWSTSTKFRYKFNKVLHNKNLFARFNFKLRRPRNKIFKLNKKLGLYLLKKYLPIRNSFNLKKFILAFQKN